MKESYQNISINLEWPFFLFQLSHLWGEISIITKINISRLFAGPLEEGDGPAAAREACEIFCGWFVMVFYRYQGPGVRLLAYNARKIYHWQLNYLPLFTYRDPSHWKRHFYISLPAGELTFSTGSSPPNFGQGSCSGLAHFFIGFSSIPLSWDFVGPCRTK